jgi:hypothetical protein
MDALWSTRRDGTNGYKRFGAGESRGYCRVVGLKEAWVLYEPFGWPQVIKHFRGKGASLSENILPSFLPSATCRIRIV